MVLVLVAAGFAFFINGPQPTEVELSSTSGAEPEIFGAGVPENFGAAAPENFGSHTATLRVRGTHPFYRGQVSIFLDNHRLQSVPLHGGGVRKQYWGLRKMPLSGGFDLSLPVAAGNHTLRIEVASGSFFQSGQKFKTRYATLGFSDKSNLDEGEVWPVVFAIKELTPSAEARIAALLKKAIS